MKDKKKRGIQLLVQAIVRDPNGKVLSDTGRKPTKSYVIQFLEYVYAVGDGPTSFDATDTVGGEVWIYFGTWPAGELLTIDAPIHTSTHGIVVGTGDTAETNIDHKLETQLTEGTGAGQITYGVQVIGTAGVVGANVDLELKRSFTNNTGSTITVKEAGLYAKLSTVDNYHCLLRGVFATGIDVPDKCSLTVIYTLRTTV